MKIVLAVLALLLSSPAWGQAAPDQSQKLAELSQGATVTPSGLRYKILVPGTGAQPRAGQTVTAEYTGRLLDGTVFDASSRQTAPFQFAVGTGQVIKGWDEAFLDMKKGERRLLIIPPALGYGSRGAGQAIPPDSWLVFEVALVGIRG